MPPTPETQPDEPEVRDLLSGGEDRRRQRRTNAPSAGSAKSCSAPSWSRWARASAPPRCSSRSPSAALLALGVIVGAATIHDLRSRGGSLPGGAFLALVLLLLAFGMYQRRYWAVLGFEALLAFQIIVTSLALVVASTIARRGDLRGERRARGLAVLEAGAGDGSHPSRRTSIASRAFMDGPGSAATFDRLRPQWQRVPTTAS